MMRLMVVCISGLILLFASGCATLGKEHIEQIGDEAEYSFCPPAGWRQSAPNKEYPNIKVFVSRHIRGEHFRPTLNILVEETTLGVEEYVEKQKTEVLPNLKGFELVAEEPIEIGTHRRLAYKLNEAKTGEKLICSQDFIIEKGKVFALTFITTAVQYERMKSTFERSIATFKVKQKKSETPASDAPLSPPGQ